MIMNANSEWFISMLKTRCLWGKEERNDIVESLLFKAYLVTSEILLRWDVDIKTNTNVFT